MNISIIIRQQQPSRILYVIGLLLLTGLLSCKKLVTIDPPTTSIDSKTAFSNDATAASVLTGLYDQMSGLQNFAAGMGGVDVIAGLSADEITAYPATIEVLREVYANALLSTDAPGIWLAEYNYIYAANAAVEGLAASSSLSAPVKKQLVGEAKFMRAFYYFYLVNLYGDVPLILSTNYQRNAVASRTAADSVWQQILVDAKDAEDSLSTGFTASDAVTASSDRVRPTQWAASALLARIDLYTGDYADAESESSKVIQNTGLFSLPADLNQVFLANSSEAIWQLEPVVSGYDTWDGNVFILTADPGPDNPGSLSSFLLRAFEPGDGRQLNWIDSVVTMTGVYYYPYKYKVKVSQAMPEYTMMLRLAEQYLIRAEARARQSRLVGPQGAQADLNAIRHRAGLGDYAGNTSQDSVIGAILHERQVELFTEWGHRWLDLKRTGQLDAVMGGSTGVCQAKGGTWSPNWALYPVPFQTALQDDPNLTQNQGY